RTPVPPAADATLIEARTPPPPAADATIVEPATPRRPLGQADATVVDASAPVAPASESDPQTVYVPAPKREPVAPPNGAGAVGLVAGTGDGAAGGAAVRDRTAPQPAKGGGITRLWPLALAAVLLVAAGVGIRLVVAGGGKSPAKPTETATSAAANPTNPATAQATGTQTGTATATATASPTATVTPADKVDVATLLRPGASVVKSVPVPGKDAGDPGQLVVQSQAPGASGCQRPFLDIYRPDKSGKWASTWDATQQPSADKALLPDVQKSGDQCFPAIEALNVQPLIDNGPLHGFASIIVDARGTRRLIDFPLDDATRPIALDFNATTTPGASVQFADGKPQGISVSENAYAADSSGVNEGYDKPYGRYSQVYTWDEGKKTFAPGRPQLALNCTGGKLTKLGNSALQAQ